MNKRFKFGQWYQWPANAIEKKLKPSYLLVLTGQNFLYSFGILVSKETEIVDLTQYYLPKEVWNGSTLMLKGFYIDPPNSIKHKTIRKIFRYA